jgi:hypothetical protein
LDNSIGMDLKTLKLELLERIAICRMKPSCSR